MTNVLMETCFDSEMKINEKAIMSLFPAPHGKEVDLSTSIANVFSALSMTELNDEFVINYIDKMDILKLYRYGSITKNVFVNRLDAMMKFVIHGKVGDHFERFQLLIKFINENFEGLDKESVVMDLIELVNMMMPQIDTDEEMEMYYNDMVKLMDVNNLILSEFHEVLATVEDYIPHPITPNSIDLMYLLSNEKALITYREAPSVVATDLAHVLMLNPSILKDEGSRKRLIDMITHCEMV